MTLNFQTQNDKKSFLEDTVMQYGQETKKKTTNSNKISQNNSRGEHGTSMKFANHALTNEQKSRSSLIDNQKYGDSGEDEEFNAKFALLDAENTPSNNMSVMKTQAFTKKKSLDSWDQEEPGLTDVRSFGNKLSAFNSKQFYQGNRQFPFRNGSNYTYRFGNRSNLHFGGNGGNNSRSLPYRNQPDIVGGLVVSSTKYSPKYTVPQSPVVEQSIQKSVLPSLSKKEEEHPTTAAITTTITPSATVTTAILTATTTLTTAEVKQQIEEKKQVGENISSDEENKTNQGIKNTLTQFQKWENKEQRDSGYLNTTKKKYGLATPSSSVAQLPQKAAYNFHFSSTPSQNLPITMSEMRIYGNSFVSMKKEQLDQINNISGDPSSVHSSKLKKIDLNNNLHLPDQINSQILFPSSLNINLHIPNNQSFIDQQQLQQQQQQQQQLALIFSKYKQTKDIAAVSNIEEAVPTSQIGASITPITQEVQQSSIQPIPQMSMIGQQLDSNETKTNLEFLQYFKKEMIYNNGVQQKQMQIFNMDSSRITPIHSERIYHQVEPEAEAIPVVSSRIIDLNLTSQLKSKSLSPLKFPKHRAIPPMRMKFKKKEKEENLTSDAGALKNQQQNMDLEDNLLQNSILCIKNIIPQTKLHINQKQGSISSVNLHGPANIEQMDQLLHLISPSLYSPLSPNKAKINSPVATKVHIKEVDLNEKKEDWSTPSQQNLSNENPKMKVFSLKFNGGGGLSIKHNNAQEGNIVHSPLIIQKFLRQKQQPSPRMLSPHRSLQNQIQQSSIPSLIVHQFHNIGQSNQVESKYNSGSPNKKEQVQQGFTYTMEQLVKQKNKIGSNPTQYENKTLQNGSFMSSNQHHIDFMDFIQGKSASFTQKQVTSSENKKQEEDKKMNAEVELQKDEPQPDGGAFVVPPINNSIKKISSQSKFLTRKMSPNPVRKVKTALIPNSQSQTQLNFHTSFKSQQAKVPMSKYQKFGTKNQTSLQNEENSILRGTSQKGKNNLRDQQNQFVVINSYKRKLNTEDNQTFLSQEDSSKVVLSQQ